VLRWISGGAPASHQFYKQETAMNWDQIEVKWAAMARRVRSDLPQKARPAPNQTPPLTQPNNLPEPLPAEVSSVNAR